MDRFERFTLAIFTITRYWNRIATEEMQKHGLKGPYAQNRYRAPICLTEEGIKLAADVRRKADIALQAAGQGLSDEVRLNMYRALDIIAGNMREICEGDITLEE